MYRASETGIIDPTELASARRLMTPAEYEQEFECSFDAAVRGAYWGETMNALESHGGITTVKAEPDTPTHIVMDLGMNDATACWFFHVRGNSPRFHSYAEYTNMGLPAIVNDWRARGHTYGKVIGPHDLMVRELGSGKTRLETLRGLGCDVIVAPNLPVIDGINMVRNLLPRCEFDSVACKDGIEALRQYRSDWDDKKGVLRLVPLHDWTSHPSDAMRYLAVTGLDALQGEWSNALDYSAMDKAICA